jgi:hypothetical protein
MVLIMRCWVAGMENPCIVGKLKVEINKCSIMVNCFNIEAIGK